MPLDFIEIEEVTLDENGNIQENIPNKVIEAEKLIYEIPIRGLSMADQ